MKKLLVIILTVLLIVPMCSCKKDEPAKAAKPVIYLYPEEDPVDAKPVVYAYPDEDSEILVKLDYSGTLTCTYPAYDDGWHVFAKPDGTLFDKDGKEYNYLYWEGVSGTEYDFSRGFCVKGEDTAAFLENALAELGLTRREANEFIVYWLPRMERNKYNLISFQDEAYTNSAKLHITPTPDSICRVFMTYVPLENEVDIEPQQLPSFDRNGFTVVEWGGCEIVR